jgi:lipoate-protein ligase B
VHFERLSYQSALEQQSQWISEAKGLTTKSVQVLSFESEPVITIGIRGRAEKDLLRESLLKVLPVDRGGEATYHGPGQLVLFPVVHLPTWNLSVRAWVGLLLDTTRDFLNEFAIPTTWDESKPGLFTANGKIASVGLKIQSGWSSHGLALNVKGDLSSFDGIRACGVKGAAIDQMDRWIFREHLDLGTLSKKWEDHFMRRLRGP